MLARTASNPLSAYGREIILRSTAAAAAPLFEHMRQDPNCEQMAFGLAGQAPTADGTIFLLNEFIIPHKCDLAKQSAVAVCPTRDYQALVYHLAKQTRKSIIEFHTHPEIATPAFSDTDAAFAYPNAKCIAEKLPDPVTLVMVVGNNRFTAFDGVVSDRYRPGEFCQLNRFEVLGRPSSVWSLGAEYSDRPPVLPDVFDRQQRIPGWNQEGLERQRVGIFGAGGNGAVLLQTLVSIGVGRRGFIALADDDLIEPSNLPRIPYATDEQVGIPKVAAAAHYAARKSPGTPIYAFPCRFSEPPVLDRMKAASVLFYAGDSHAGRKEINDLAVKFGIPLIDLGCDVQVNDREVIAGGQVRLVLPGENACLCCCGGFDASQAAIDQMNPRARARYAAQGYVRGAQGVATPSVANLNGICVHEAISQFLAIVCGRRFCEWDFLHFDQFSGRTIPARTTLKENCPLCGPMGRLLEGDTLPPREVDPPTISKFNAKPTKRKAILPRPSLPRARKTPAPKPVTRFPKKRGKA
jgi:molybdopterin/thiamine biosynthesis adenylyltransferase